MRSRLDGNVGLVIGSGQGLGLGIALGVRVNSVAPGAVNTPM